MLLHYPLYRFSWPSEWFLYCGTSKISWFIELSEYQVCVIHIILNSNLSVMNRLKRFSKFFCKLLIFRCSIEKILLSKLFKLREDSSGTFKIKCINEIFIWILIVVSIYLGTYDIMLEWRRKFAKKKQSLTKKPGFVRYRLQFYIANKKSYHRFDFLESLSIFPFWYQRFLC